MHKQIFKSIRSYGEYSLSHWIELILTKRIELPPYQRYFVWDENSVRNIMISFKNGHHVPPVTIAEYKEFDQNGQCKECKAYIIDGQQRLTSILLAYLGFYIDKTKIRNPTSLEYADPNDENDDIEENINGTTLDWRMTEIQNMFKGNIVSLKSELQQKAYFKQKNLIDESFNWDDCSLGFSYIKFIPSSPNYNEINQDQKSFYATIFRTINATGRNLELDESRAAFYWCAKNTSIEKLLKAEFFKGIKINNRLIDFVKILSFLAQVYYLNKNKDDFSRYAYGEIAKGYSSKKDNFEFYIESFVHAVVDEKSSSSEFKFGVELAKIDDIESRIQKLTDQLNLHELRNKVYTSIIDAEYFLFGFIYKVFFLNKDISPERFNEISSKLHTFIDDKKQDSSYTKKPSLITRIRDRIKESILTYCKDE